MIKKKHVGTYLNLVSMYKKIIISFLFTNFSYTTSNIRRVQLK